MESILFLIPAMPLLAFVINILLGKFIPGKWGHYVSWVAMATSFAVSVLAVLEVRSSGHAIQQHLWNWMPGEYLGGFEIPLNIYIDQLTSIMILVITGIGFLIHIYSAGYMGEDDGYYRFFAYLSLFVFAMLVLVLGDNYLVMFFGWEGVGLCSYLLIGYWFNDSEARHHLPTTQLIPRMAAQKAFIVNRIGDFGFLIGMFLVFTTFGTLNFFGEEGVFEHVAGKGETTLTIIGLLLFVGAMGKSAQFPLFVWLPDAMAGPTPVSALIHAATMVTAGVYMTVRSSAIFSAAPNALLVILIVGLITCFIAATMGLVQNDIKGVMAYSTVSQLGYMIVGVGSGAFIPAIFHLMTHAFFKALLFLGAGSVIHGTHTQDMRQMGGLKKYMPITYWTMVCGALALAGVIATAGFFSKDEILVGAWHAGYPWAAVIGWGVAFMTAFYTFRMIFMTFHGEPKFDTNHPPHESPLVMTLPLIFLAIPSLAIGALVGWPADEGLIHQWLEPVFEHGAEAHAGTTSALAILAAEDGGHSVPSAMLTNMGFLASIVLSFAGIALAWLMYGDGRISAKAVGRRFYPLYDLFYRKWYVDEIYTAAVVHPVYDEHGESADLSLPNARPAAPDATPTGISVILAKWVDQRFIDGIVNGVAYLTGGVSQRLRKVQTGVVSNYALAIVLGTVLIVGVYLIFGPQFLGK
ncbi:MAG: NADH-quinone oxidoreductase subunit L [Thermomicrobiales bacterium]